MLCSFCTDHWCETQYLYFFHLIHFHDLTDERAIDLAFLAGPRP